MVARFFVNDVSCLYAKKIMKPAKTEKRPKRWDGTSRTRSSTFFRLDRSFENAKLSLVDRKGVEINADFRRYTGVMRDAVREFAMQFERSSRMIDWGGAAEWSGAEGVPNPDIRLLDLAAAAGMLVDADFVPLAVDTEERRLVLRVRRASDGNFRADRYVDSDDSTTSDDMPYAVSPCHVISGHRLHKVRDLGPEWFRDGELTQPRIARKDLPVYLSFALSHLPGIELRLDGYTVRTARERAADCALIFSEIDEYDYLHVRPVSALQGLPPDFLDDHEITRVATLDDDERELTISDIVFPTDPAGQFRSMLARMGKESKNTVFEEAGRFVLTPEFAARFLSEQMASLVNNFMLYESEKLGRFKIKPVQPRLRLRLSSGIDFLEGNADIEIDGETLTYSRFLDEYRKQSYITLSDGTRAFPEPRAVARLQRLIHRTGSDDSSISISFFDYPALARSPEVEIEGDAWKRPEEFYRGYNEIASKNDLFEVEGATLRPYQEYGVKWLDYLRTHEFGGCLADEMGLGKTVQTIAILRHIYADGETRPTLIVVPTSLLYNWIEEFGRFAPELSVALWYGSDRKRDPSPRVSSRVVLTTYAVMRLDIESLATEQYCYVVLDEAQSIKNLETKTAQAALKLKAPHRLALSGTPIENSLDELYSLFDFLNRGMFGTQSEFLSTYVRPIRENGDEEALRDLRARIYPFVLRRTKRDVLPELPEKVEQVATVELDSAHLAFYHRRRLELKAEIERAIERDGVSKSSFLILQAFTELRRLASVPEAEGAPISFSAKRLYLRNAVPEITENGHKCLIFANYLAAVELVSEDLGTLGVGNLVMTGATTDRAMIVKRFQSDPTIGALVMTLKTGGLGLNLTAADYVFIFDPWWNRSAEAQAIDRTHRIGQKNPVFAYRLIARETIEEKILQLQERKAELVSALIASDSDAYKKLDEGDIQYLLR